MKKLKIFAVLGLLLVGVMAGFTACGEEKILAPVEISVDEENKLTWSDVGNARSYIVSVTNVESGEITESPSRRESFSLSGLAVGDYEIRIKAIGAEEDQESEWSETYYFHRAYETGCLYKLVNNTEYEITKVGSAAGTVYIEDEYRGKPVVSIAKAAFKGSTRIENVVIGNNVRSIGDNAFNNCRKLTAVTIPESVTSIGVSAFQGCILLENVEIPDSVTVINDFAFAYCRAMKTLSLGEYTTTIGDSAFLECETLETLTIPDSVTYIDMFAFSGAEGLKTLQLGNGLTTIDEYAFSGTAALETIGFANSSSLETIAMYAFSGAEKLEELAFPNGLKDIGYAAFYECANLAKVTIPDTVTHVGAFAFDGTKFETEAEEAGAEFIYADKWVISCNKEVKEAITEVTEKTLQEGTEGIADHVFIECPNLTMVVLPTSVRVVGNYAFNLCPKLWKVETDSVELIGQYAFSQCKVLSNIVLGEGLKTIESYAFYGCTLLDNSSLGGSIIPESVTRIGTDAFKATALWNKPDESGIIYAGNWVVGYSGGISFPQLKAETVGVADYAFYQCETLQSITGLSYAKYIGRGAFFECTSLATVSLNNNLRKIEDYTFYKCSSLFSVSMPARLQEIGRSAFYKCELLDEVNLTRGDVETIAPYAFYGCINIKKAELGKSLVDVGEYAFYKCSSIQELSFPDTLKTIGNKAYYKCESLKKLHLGESLESIGDYAFHGCSSLKGIVIPDSATAIGRNAFYKCVAVETLRLGEGLESIGDYAFYNLQNLIELQLPSNVSIGKYAFKGCNSLTSLVLKSDVASIGDHAFYGCKNMTVYTDATDVSTLNWSERWNSSHRPVVWGCTLSEDGTYVVSLKITETTFTDAYVNVKVPSEENAEETTTVTKVAVTAPERAGYVFVGWATKAGGSVAYQADETVTLPVGTTLYSVWETYTPKITFVHNVAGCSLTEATVAYGETYEMPQDLTAADGYVAEGFYCDAEMTDVFDFSAAIVKDTTVYVKWALKE